MTLPGQRSANVITPPTLRNMTYGGAAKSKYFNFQPVFVCLIHQLEDRRRKKERKMLIRYYQRLWTGPPGNLGDQVICGFTGAQCMMGNGLSFLSKAADPGILEPHVRLACVHLTPPRVTVAPPRPTTHLMMTHTLIITHTHSTSTLRCLHTSDGDLFPHLSPPRSGSVVPRR